MASDVATAKIELIDPRDLKVDTPGLKEVGCMSDELSEGRPQAPHEAGRSPNSADASTDLDDDNINESDEIDTDDLDEQAAKTEQQRMLGRRVALTVGAIATLLVAVIGGWFGQRAQQAQRAEQQRNVFLQVGRQGALNLTTINYTHVDADIQRVLDSSTGSFHDDFQKRSPALAEFVKKAQSKTQGTITESGIESISGDTARVLVAVSVNITNIGAADQAPRHWRMRIDVHKDGDTIKVSNVGFVV